jgi:ribokinase
VRAGETISSHAYENRVGGKGANQAIAIVRAGGTVQFYGIIGKDGIWIRDIMMKCGIDVGGIIISDVRGPSFVAFEFLMIIYIRNPLVVLLSK